MNRYDMSEVINMIPQVGTSGNGGNPTADSDRVQAPVVSAGPTDSGGGRTHSGGNADSRGGDTPQTTSTTPERDPEYVPSPSGNEGSSEYSSIETDSDCDAKGKKPKARPAQRKKKLPNLRSKVKKTVPPSPPRTEPAEMEVDAPALSTRASYLRPCPASKKRPPPSQESEDLPTKRGKGPRPDSPGASQSSQPQKTAAEKETERRRARRALEKSLEGQVPANPPGDTVTILSTQAKTIHRVAKNSSNLKGDFKNLLYGAALAVQDIANHIGSRQTDDEAKRIREHNEALTAEIAELRREVASLRRLAEAKTAESTAGKESAPSAPPPARNPSRSSPRSSSGPPPNEGDTIFARVETLIEARFLALEAKLAPLLATSATTPAKERPAPPASKPPTAKPPAPPAGKKTAPASEQPRPRYTAAEDPSVPGPSSAPMAPTAPPQDTWATVVGRKQKKKKQSTPQAGEKTGPNPPPAPAASETKKSDASGPPKGQAQAATNERKGGRPRTLRVPASSAVTIKLPTSEGDCGNAYRDVLREARSKVNPTEVGISDVRFGVTATGARILRIRGDKDGSKADALAAKLREALSEGTVEIGRPEKTASIRLTGLDDTATPEEICAAIARVGGCRPDQVHCPRLTRAARGSATTVAHCPIRAVKAIMETGRLLIGWISAGVTLLQPRRVSCLKCRMTGHTRATCSSTTDRSEECHRCSGSGHKQADCRAPPHCSLCMAAGKPSGHACGSVNTCAALAPAKESNRAPPTVTPAPESQDMEEEDLEGSQLTPGNGP